MSRRPRTRRRLLGLLLVILGLELSLQLAGPLVQRMLARSDGPPDPASELTGLCVGDSNTYGLNVPRVLAWPARLAGRLRPRYDAPVAVVNRGVPGRNSAQVAAALVDDLRGVDPDLVLIQVGVNDTWNTAADDSGPAAWLGRLKLVRLARVLAEGVTTAEAPPFSVTTDAEGEFVVDRGGHIERVNPGGSGLARRGPELESSLRRGLGRALAAVRDHGATPVLLTYPEFQDAHGEVNACLRRLAADQQLLLVDLEQAFADHFAEQPYAMLMFNDHHPNARGYDLLAGDVEAALEAAGLIAPRRDAGARRVIPPPMPPALSAGPDGQLDLSGPPGWAFQVAVGCLAGPGEGLPLAGDDASRRLPLRDDPVLTASRALPDLSGWLDASGRARVAVSPALASRAPGEALWACLVLLHDPSATDADALVAAVSEPVRLRF